MSKFMYQLADDSFYYEDVQKNNYEGDGHLIVRCERQEILKVIYSCLPEYYGIP